MDLYIILALIQGFIFGWIVHKMIVNYQVRKVLEMIAKRHNISLEEMAEEVFKEQKLIRVPFLFTEAVDNSIMLYNKETKQFVCQAPTVEELAKKLFEYQKIKYAVVDHDKQRLWFVDGQIKKDLKEIE